MFDPILSQSIQRWEYEGGRILPGTNGHNAGRDQNKWIQSRTKARPVKWDVSSESATSSRRLNQSAMPTDRRKSTGAEQLKTLQIMKPKLLVVDDDHSIRKSLAKLLKMEDFVVLSARDADEAIDLFSYSPVDLVVLEVNLGEESGWKVFETMKQLNPFVPTILITVECDQREVAIDAGAEALIEKPIDVPAFLQIVRDLLAETSQEPLARIFGDDKYCRYVARYHPRFFPNLDERRSAPLKLSRSLAAVLSTRNPVRAA